MKRPTTRRRWDLSSLAGLPIGVGLILVGQFIEGGNVLSLLQIAAAVIVFGGTLGAVLISFTVSDVLAAARSLKDVVFDTPDAPEAILATIVRLSGRARREGIMSLEDELDRLEDPFLRRGLGLAVDGTNPATLRQMLEAESATREEHDELPAEVYESAGGYAPTIGILGAVLGLIQVMQNLTDPARLGEGIAVAFVATLYGVGSANLVFLPMAAKLRSKAARRRRRRELMLEGILAIQEGMNPRLIDHKLRGLMAADAREPRSLARGPRAA